MSENSKNSWPNHRRHEAHDGEVSGAFCGKALKSIRTMALNFCMRNPTCSSKYRLMR